VKVARHISAGKKKPRPYRCSPQILASKGWSARAAAMQLGCSPGHLLRVLRGERPQGRLLPLVADLPNLNQEDAR
jgi:hypothetical protein